jgi:hypothetical protein
VFRLERSLTSNTIRGTTRSKTSYKKFNKTGGTWISKVKKFVNKNEELVNFNEEVDKFFKKYDFTME